MLSLLDITFENPPTTNAAMNRNGNSPSWSTYEKGHGGKPSNGGDALQWIIGA